MLNRFRATLQIVAFVVSILGTPVAVRAESVWAATYDRWVPSFGIQLGLFGHKQSGTVESFDGAMAQLSPPDSRSGGTYTPFVGAGLELMSPALLSTAGHPQIFVGAELNGLFGTESNVASAGNPDGPNLPNRLEFPESAITGVGSRTTTEFGSVGFGAGAGIAFSGEVLGFGVRVKPSFQWTRFDLNVSGRVLDVIKPAFDDPFVRTVLIERRESRSFNGIGPGLELEFVAVSRPRFLVTVFGRVGAYRILGNRGFDFSGATTILDEGQGLPTDTYTANFSADLAAWQYRGNVGIRFSWTGD
jgi:hypothetical protein